MLRGGKATQVPPSKVTKVASTTQVHKIICKEKTEMPVNKTICLTK